MKQGYFKVVKCETYQETSAAQRMNVSSIIKRDVLPIKQSQAEAMEVVEAPKQVSDEEKYKLTKLKNGKFDKHIIFALCKVSKCEIKNQVVYQDHISRLHIISYWLIFNGRAKLKLALMEFLYCREIVENYDVSSAGSARSLYLPFISYQSVRNDTLM